MDADSPVVLLYQIPPHDWEVSELTRIVRFTSLMTLLTGPSPSGLTAIIAKTSSSFNPVFSCASFARRWYVWFLVSPIIAISLKSFYLIQRIPSFHGRSHHMLHQRHAKFPIHL